MHKVDFFWNQSFTSHFQRSILGFSSNLINSLNKSLWPSVCRLGKGLTTPETQTLHQFQTRTSGSKPQGLWLLLGKPVTYVSGLGKVDNRICMVLEWTPEEASLLQDRPSLLQRQSIHLKGTWETRHLYETCACIIHTIHLQLSCSLKHSTINLSLLHHRDSKQPVTGYEDQGTGVMTSQCMKHVLVSHT